MTTYKIGIKECHFPILLTKSILYNVIKYTRKNRRKTIPIEITALVEIRYINYLLKIFYNNKEFSMAYQLPQTGHIDLENLCKIFKLQFNMLLIDGDKCFDSVRIKKINGIETKYLFKCSSEFFSACHNLTDKFDLSFFS